MRFSCGGCMLPAASTRSVSLNVARFHFSAVFWNRATSCTSVVAEKCRKNRFGGGVWNRRKNRISAGKMLHDSKFAPKIGIVQQNSSFPSVGPHLLAGSCGMVSAASLVFGR